MFIFICGFDCLAEAGVEIAKLQIRRHECIAIILHELLRVGLACGKVEALGGELGYGLRLVPLNVHRFNDVALTFDDSKCHQHVASLVVDFGSYFDVAETVRLIHALQILNAGVDQILAIFPMRKNVSLLHSDVWH